MTTDFIRIEACRGCREPVLDAPERMAMDDMPLAGSFCTNPADAPDVQCFPLTWIQCLACSLVQVAEDISDAELYSHYNYASSTVAGLVHHFEEFSHYLVQLVQEPRPRVLEVGCNDGVLLRRLPTHWQLIGVDPSDVAAAHTPRNYTLLASPFSLTLADKLREFGPFDLITSSNTLAHISDLAGALEGIASLLAPTGVAVIEVHDLDSTIATNQWDTIYHEHKVEWSERSLTACLSRVGLRTEAVNRTGLHGGALRIACRLATPKCDWRTRPSLEEIDKLGNLRQAYESRRLSNSYLRAREAMSRNNLICAYGASGRANVWLNQLSELAIEFIADDSPLRQNKWLPRLAIPVVGPQSLYSRPTDVCIITAWNYANDIVSKHPNYHGTWIPTFDAP